MESDNNQEFVKNPPSSMTVPGMRDLLSRPVFIHFLIYLLYRILRSLILFESDCYLLLKRIFSPERFSKPSEGKTASGQDVELMTILGRRRLYPSDVARDVDFVLFHSELDKFSILDDPKWQLYSINSQYAYFVEMPFGVSEYSFKFCDSISEAQFGEAQRVARVSWDRFIQKCDKNWQFKGGIGKILYNILKYYIY